MKVVGNVTDQMRELLKRYKTYDEFEADSPLHDIDKTPYKMLFHQDKLLTALSADKLYQCPDSAIFNQSFEDKYNSENVIPNRQKSVAKAIKDCAKAHDLETRAPAMHHLQESYQGLSSYVQTIGGYAKKAPLKNLLEEAGKNTTILQHQIKSHIELEKKLTEKPSANNEQSGASNAMAINKQSEPLESSIHNHTTAVKSQLSKQNSTLDALQQQNVKSAQSEIQQLSKHTASLSSATKLSSITDKNNAKYNVLKKSKSALIEKVNEQNKLIERIVQNEYKAGNLEKVKTLRSNILDLRSTQYQIDDIQEDYKKAYGQSIPESEYLPKQTDSNNTAKALEKTEETQLIQDKQVADDNSKTRTKTVSKLRQLTKTKNIQLGEVLKGLKDMSDSAGNKVMSAQLATLVPSSLVGSKKVLIPNTVSLPQSSSNNVHDTVSDLASDLSNSLNQEVNTVDQASSAFQSLNNAINTNVSNLANDINNPFNQGVNKLGQANTMLQSLAGKINCCSDLQQPEIKAQLPEIGNLLTDGTNLLSSNILESNPLANTANALSAYQAELSNLMSLSSNEMPAISMPFPAMPTSSPFDQMAADLSQISLDGVLAPPAISLPDLAGLNEGLPQIDSVMPTNINSLMVNGMSLADIEGEYSSTYTQLMGLNTTLSALQSQYSYDALEAQAKQTLAMQQANLNQQLSTLNPENYTQVNLANPYDGLVDQTYQNAVSQLEGGFQPLQFNQANLANFSNGLVLPDYHNVISSSGSDLENAFSGFNAQLLPLANISNVPQMLDTDALLGEALAEMPTTPNVSGQLDDMNQKLATLSSGFGTSELTAQITDKMPDIPSGADLSSLMSLAFIIGGIDQSLCDLPIMAFNIPFPDISLSLPQIPNIVMPAINLDLPSLPSVNFPSLPDFSGLSDLLNQIIATLLQILNSVKDCQGALLNEINSLINQLSSLLPTWSGFGMSAVSFPFPFSLNLPDLSLPNINLPTIPSLPQLPDLLGMLGSLIPNLIALPSIPWPSIAPLAIALACVEYALGIYQELPAQAELGVAAGATLKCPSSLQPFIINKPPTGINYGPGKTMVTQMDNAAFINFIPSQCCNNSSNPYISATQGMLPTFCMMSFMPFENASNNIDADGQDVVTSSSTLKCALCNVDVTVENPNQETVKIHL